MLDFILKAMKIHCGVLGREGHDVIGRDGQSGRPGQQLLQKNNRGEMSICMRVATVAKEEGM